MQKNLISVSEAAEMTARYKSQKEMILMPDERDRGKLLTCETFTKDVFSDLINLEECVGIRVYCGMDENFLVKLIVCGVGSRNEDLYLPGILEADDQQVIERGVRCPEQCPPSSRLNP